MLESEFIHEVEQLAKSDVFAQVLDKIETEFVADWKTAINVDERERAHAMVSAVDAIRQKITSIAKNREFTAFNRRHVAANQKTG